MVPILFVFHASSTVLDDDFCQLSTEQGQHHSALSFYASALMIRTQGLIKNTAGASQAVFLLNR
jgi:hypothetical protein